jgi:crossover junction endodeoxyribonuclease RuvC
VSALHVHDDPTVLTIGCLGCIASRRAADAGMTGEAFVLALPDDVDIDEGGIMTLYIGIDPGVDGAIAIIDHFYGLVDIVPMPTLDDGPKGRRRVNAYGVAEFLRPYVGGVGFVALETVSVRPGEGAVGAFAFGRGVGAIEGVIAALGISSVGVTPQAWKKAHGIPAGSGKDVSRSRAIALWPADAHHFASKADGGYGPIGQVEGRAEAALIAEWCRRQHVGAVGVVA